MLFGNFVESNEYREYTDKQQVITSIRYYMDLYNQEKKKPINIVLFDDAIRMLCKINRIISNMFGHALLITLGGSGSHSLTRLVAYMQELFLYQIEVDKDFGQYEWLEFLKNMLRQIVLKNSPGVFLVSDDQLVQEKFLEDLNNLLNVGEIQSLFAPDEKESLMTEVKDITEKKKLNLNPIQLWEYFVSQCKMQLHIVLCLSPIGDKLRSRIRSFPSMISCTSPIWVQSWNNEALHEVAHFVLENSVHIDFPSELIEKLSHIFLEVH